MWKTLPMRLVLVACLCPALLAQRPRSVAEALQKYEQVRERSEAERRRAVSDLGDFPDAAATTVLLAELARAESQSHRQTVVRALGQQHRDGCVDALLEVLLETSNVRVMDSAAEGLARQGDEGVRALGAVLEREKGASPRRAAACDGLGRAAGDAARDLLVAETRRAAGRDRLPPLRALRDRAGDAVVDEARLLLARDQDPLVATTSLQQLADQGHAQAPALALELHRRLGAGSSPEQHAAVLSGLLLEPTEPHREAIVGEAGAADDPFGRARGELWRQALADPEFVRWLADNGPQRRLVGERIAAATALGLVEGPLRPTAGAALVRMLGQREPELVRAAAASAVVVAPTEAGPALQKVLATGPEPLLPIALAALHDLRAADASWPAELLRHAAGPAPGLRAAALRLLARRADADPTTALAAARDGLTHKAWTVRAAAVELIVALRQPAGVPALFERMEQEQGRLRDDVVGALRELTRLEFPSTSAWRDWWAKEADTFRVAEPRAPESAGSRGARVPATTVSYWDIPVRSDRLVFVVDVSGSMNQPFGTGSGTRLEEAKRQLARVFGALPGKAKANLVAFGNEATAFAETLQVVDEKRRKAALAYAAALVGRGATNVHAALERAFADAEVDTIFLLTDGQPSAGFLVAPEAILREVRRWNVGRGVRIHTVAIGGRSDFLERLAADSGGEHTVAR